MLSGIRSALSAGDFVLIDDSPIADAEELGDPSPVDIARHMGAVFVTPPKKGGYSSDAEKRTAMLNRAKTIANKRGREEGENELWVVWLDGDELLLYGEYLADLCYRAAFETGAGGFPLRIVEFDGSVAISYGKIIRASAVVSYETSSYQVRLRNGVIVALPNEKVCGAGGIPAVSQELFESLHSRQEEIMAHYRPPLAGEPHILHRSLYRSPERDVERQSDAEARWFKEILGPDGAPISEVRL